LVVLDATQSLNEEERRLLFAVEGRPALTAIHKSDLAAGGEPKLSDHAPVALRTSALTGEGIAALRERILELATGGAASRPGMLASCATISAVLRLSGLVRRRPPASDIPHEIF
jgi:tRNA modification GTPase